MQISTLVGVKGSPEEARIWDLSQMDPLGSKNKVSTRWKPTSKKISCWAPPAYCKARKNLWREHQWYPWNHRPHWILMGRSFSIAWWMLQLCSSSTLAEADFHIYNPIEKNAVQLAKCRKHFGFQNSLIQTLRKSCQWCKIIYYGDSINRTIN